MICYTDELIDTKAQIKYHCYKTDRKTPVNHSYHPPSDPDQASSAHPLACPPPSMGGEILPGIYLCPFFQWLEAMQEIIYGRVDDRAAITKYRHAMYPPQERLPSLFIVPLDIYVLFFQRDVADNENLGITGRLIVIAAGEIQRIAVQVVEHVLYLHGASELIEDHDVLSLIVIKRVEVIRHPVDFIISERLHDGAGLSPACLAEPVFCPDLPEGILKFFLP